MLILKKESEMRMSKLCVVLALSVTASGCVSTGILQLESAGFTGCTPENNEISNIKGLGSYWNATCNGKKYLCTSLKSQASCALAVD
jgi:hypothetical protein